MGVRETLGSNFLIRKKSENYEHDLKTEIAMIMHGTDSRPALCNLRMKRSAKIGTIL